MEKTEKSVVYVDGKLRKVDIRKKEVRIIDGKMKCVETVNGDIVKILGDRKNPYDKLMKESIERYEQKLRYLKAPIREEDISRFPIQPKIMTVDAKYRKSLLKKKVDSGILKDEVLELKGANELLDDWAIDKGYKDYNEYLDLVAIGRGFTCYEEYDKIWEYYPGMPDPIRENRKNTRFLGIYVAESSVNKLFKGSQRMRLRNPGYDIICNKGYKIDVKASTLSATNTFGFHINENNIANYFILIGYNNIIELKPLHMWIIGSEDIIHDYHMHDWHRLMIPNEPMHIEYLQKYERIDKLKELREICDEFNSKHKIGMNDCIPTRHQIIESIRLLALERELENLNVKKRLLTVSPDKCTYSSNYTNYANDNNVLDIKKKAN